MNEPTVATLEQDLEDANTRIAELEKELDEKKDEVNELEIKNRELESSLSDYADEAEKETAFPCETIHDEMKRDYLLEIWDKYTPEEIEKALPRRY